MATHSSILAWRIPMNRGAWRAIQSIRVHKESDMSERLSTHNADSIDPSSVFALQLRETLLSPCQHLVLVGFLCFLFCFGFFCLFGHVAQHVGS